MQAFWKETMTELPSEKTTFFMDDAITPPGLTNMVSVLKYNHKGVTDDGWPRLVIQKSNLTLVVAVAFLLYVSCDAYACL